MVITFWTASKAKHKTAGRLGCFCTTQELESCVTMVGQVTTVSRSHNLKFHKTAM